MKNKYPSYAEVVKLEDLDADAVIDYENDHSNPDDRILRDAKCDIFALEKIRTSRKSNTQRIKNANSPYPAPIILMPDALSSFHSKKRETLGWIARLAATAYIINQTKLPKKEEPLITRRDLIKGSLAGLIIAGSELINPWGLKYLGKNGGHNKDEINRWWHKDFNLSGRNAIFAENLYRVIPQLRKDFNLEDHLTIGIKMGASHADPKQCDPTFKQTLEDPKLRRKILEEYSSEIANKPNYALDIIAQLWDKSKERYAQNHIYDGKTFTKKRIITDLD